MSLLVRVLIIACGAWSAALDAQPQPATGTVVFEVRPFATDVRLGKKARRQLESGGIEWGAAEGRLVVTLVDEQLIGVDVPYLTRYGETDILELPAGTYRVSCIGLTARIGRNVQAALRKGGYFNIDVMTFDVAPGMTTTILVQPTIRERSSAFAKARVPELLVSIDGGEARVVNARDDASIAWDEYAGPLKF